MESATLHVFTTFELLESILLQIPLSDLLIRAQLVNRRFRNVIRSSSALQQALFFEPATDATVFRHNPLLFIPLDQSFGDERTSRYIEEEAWSLRDIFRPHSWPQNDLKPSVSSEQRKLAVARSEASWRRMLVVQPPLKSLFLGLGSGYGTSQWCHNGSGVTMDDLALVGDIEFKALVITKDGRGRLDEVWRYGL